MRGSFGLRTRAAITGGVALAAAGAVAGFPAIASGASGSAEYVTTHGHDTGQCAKKSPCATINYAISQAKPGETIHVEKGTYHQTVDVNKAVSIVGVGASSTKINGAGLDPSSSGYYGVVYVGKANGNVTVSGLKITNPSPYTYTGKEPMAVVLQDSNSADTIRIVNDVITEGKADSGRSTDFPIGIDTFLNAASTTIQSNTISGFFQGALLEDNGPAAVSNNRFVSLIPGKTTSPTTVYPAEGVFFLADEGGTYTGQDPTGNSFSHYTGYGIAESAGYTGGYVATGCIANGSIDTNVANNTFSLTGKSKAAAIALDANGTGNNLSGTVSGNHGYVTAPSKAMEIRSTAVPPTPPNTNCGAYGTSNGGGGTLVVTTHNHHIVAKGTSHAPASAARRFGGLHAPRHRGG